jgi:hypothetical protein
VMLTGRARSYRAVRDHSRLLVVLLQVHCSSSTPSAVEAPRPPPLAYLHAEKGGEELSN